MPTIDSHQHFWDVSRFDYGWLKPGKSELYRNYLPGDLAPLLACHGVDRTVFVQAMSDIIENRFALELAAEHDWIAGIVGWFDVASPAVQSQIDEFAPHEKFVGIRVNLALPRDGRDSKPVAAWRASSSDIPISVIEAALPPSLLDGLRRVARAGLVCDVLAWGENLALVPELAKRIPELAIVLDHLGGIPITRDEFAPWSARLRDAAGCPNVVCKLSGLITRPPRDVTATFDYTPAVREAIAAFTPARLMFGSDWPVSTQAGGYDAVMSVLHAQLAALPPTERGRILGGTAAAVYGL